MRSTSGKQLRIWLIMRTSSCGLIMRLFASCKKTDCIPASTKLQAQAKMSSSSAGTASLLMSSRREKEGRESTVFSFSTYRETLSMSRRTWSIGLLEYFRSLYTGQKVQRFHGQFLVTRISRLRASLGGRIGPCSKPVYDKLCIIFSDQMIN